MCTRQEFVMTLGQDEDLSAIFTAESPASRSASVACLGACRRLRRLEPLR